MRHKTLRIQSSERKYNRHNGEKGAPVTGNPRGDPAGSDISNT